MKLIILCVLILSGVSSYAESCLVKAVRNVIDTKLTDGSDCNRTNLKDLTVEQVLYPVSTQSTIFEISYNCEKEGSALVIFDDECNGKGKFVSL